MIFQTNYKKLLRKLLIWKSFDKLIKNIDDPFMDIQNIISGKKYAKIVFSIIMVLSLVMTDIYIINYIDKCSAFNVY